MAGNNPADALRLWLGVSKQVVGGLSDERDKAAVGPAAPQRGDRADVAGRPADDVELPILLHPRAAANAASLCGFIPQRRFTPEAPR